MTIGTDFRESAEQKEKKKEKTENALEIPSVDVNLNVIYSNVRVSQTPYCSVLPGPRNILFLRRLLLLMTISRMGIEINRETTYVRSFFSRRWP